MRGVFKNICDFVQRITVDTSEVGSDDLYCRDSNDNKFLLVAFVAKAEVIVSSDNDLLVLHPWNGIAILTPADFIAQFQA